jgi:hypothetical protein
MEKIEYQVGMDGNSWFCHGPDFVNLQESTVAFGDTEEEAILEYCKLYLLLKYS